MPIDNQIDTVNIKLSPEQTQAIEETKARLSNFESEISIANKALKATKLEIERLIKDRVYQEELLDSTTLKAKVAKEELVKSQEELSTTREVLNKLDIEIKDKNLHLSTKSVELKDREDKVAKSEQKNMDSSKKLDEINKILKSNSDIFNGKISKLKEVISTF